MAKYTLRCGVCDTEIREVDNPHKSYTESCPKCGLVQYISATPKVGFSSGRNYPSDYFENQ